MARDDDSHLSDRALDLLVLDEEGERSRSARGHIETCSSCRGQLELLRQSAVHFRVHVRARTEDRVLAALGRQRGAASSGWRLWERIGLGLTVAAALVLLARQVPMGRDARHDDLRTKGDPSLTVFRRHGAGVSVLSDGASVNAGDGLRFTADPAGHRWLMVASLDASGRPTVYLPYGGASSAPIDPRHRFEDPGSITLDRTRGPERIFALFSDDPLMAADVLRALAAIGDRGPDAIRSTTRLPIPAGFQTSLLLEK